MTCVLLIYRYYSRQPNPKAPSLSRQPASSPEEAYLPLCRMGPCQVIELQRALGILESITLAADIQMECFSAEQKTFFRAPCSVSQTLASDGERHVNSLTYRDTGYCHSPSLQSPDIVKGYFCFVLSCLGLCLILVAIRLICPILFSGASPAPPLHSPLPLQALWCPVKYQWKRGQLDTSSGLASE